MIHINRTRQRLVRVVIQMTARGLEVRETNAAASAQIVAVMAAMIARLPRVVVVAPKAPSVTRVSASRLRVGLWEMGRIAERSLQQVALVY